MKKLIILFVLSASFITSSNAIDNAQKAKALKAIKHLENAWYSKLTEKLKEDSKGFSAVDFCHKRADKITSQVSDMYKGVTLKRVAVRYRNEKNRATKIDLPVLKEFYKISKKRQTPAIKVVETKKTYRIYKPLVIRKPICLKCHGNEKRMRKKLVASIDEKYPKDKAKNFKYRQSRGAIVAIIKK